MSLPPEIVDHIVDHYVLVAPADEFREFRELASWVNFTSVPDSTVPVRGRQNESYETTFFRTDLDVKTLSVLRLVSLEWNRSVTRLFRTHQWWNIHLDDPTAIKRIAACCGTDNKVASLDKSVRSLNLRYMHDLVSFVRVYSFEPQEFAGQDVDHNHIVLNSPHNDVVTFNDGKGGWRADPQFHYNKKDEHTAIRQLLDSLNCVERFVAEVKGARSTPDLRADCYDLEGLDEFVATIQYGLRAPALQHLADLSLLVPSTWHVGEVTSVLSPHARLQLRKLRLSIVDKTGPGGSLLQLITAHMVGADFNDGSFTSILGTGCPPSNVQVVHPNRENQDALWAFVGSCRRLESLAIEAAHFLELDRLQWNPDPGSKGLRDISLNRLWTSVPSILNLLAAPSGNALTLSPAARRVSLEDVKVYGDGGNWDEVFTFLRTQCPDLELFRARNLTYFTDHVRHEHNAETSFRYKDIWTNGKNEDNHDRKVLRMLHTRLVSKAGDAAYYPVSLINSDSAREDLSGLRSQLRGL